MDAEVKKAILDLKGYMAGEFERVQESIKALNVSAAAIRERQDKLAIAINVARDDVTAALSEKLHDELTTATGRSAKRWTRYSPPCPG